jgi:uncharacterized protein DUF742
MMTADPVAGRPARRLAALARPYALTDGRTRPTIELAIEALVQTTMNDWTGRHEETSALYAVANLCTQPRSVAEIAALLALPIGVARVLVGDLVDEGLVSVHATLGGDATWDERRDLIERVLGGLRAL